jgi:hypothetical protein
MNFFPNSERKTFKYCCLALLVLVFGHTPRAEGQSGRRSTKPQPESSPLPQPIATPATTPEANHPPSSALKQSVKLLIGRESTQRHLQSEDVIYASFVNRLNSFFNVTGTSIGDLKRQEAVIQAKGVGDAFVVRLSFEIDSFQNGTIILNSPDLQVEYQIFAPRSGKKLAQGKIYFQSIGGGRMRKSDWPGGTPIRITAEAAGIEAAEYVHDWLRINEINDQSKDTKEH